MAIKYKSNCKVCWASKKDAKLRERIYYCTFKREEGDESLYQIADSVGIPRAGMYNHVKKHIKENLPSGEVVTAKRLELVKQTVAKQLEVSLDHDSIIPKQDFEMALDEVIASGLSELRLGTKKATINQLLAAAKVKGDFSSKKRGQDVEIIKTMYRMMNGNPQETAGIPSPGAD